MVTIEQGMKQQQMAAAFGGIPGCYADTRASVKERLDRKIAQMQDQVEKVKKLRELFEKHDELATALDLMREINVF